MQISAREMMVAIAVRFGVLGVVGGCAAVIAATSPLEIAMAQAQLKIGNEAPQPRIASVVQGDRATFNRASWKGKVVVLDFWATWCGACITSIPHFNALARQFHGRPILFLIVAEDEGKRVARFLRSKPMNAAIAIDHDSTTYKAYGIPALPTTILIDEHGRVAAITDPQHITTAVLGKALASQTVSVPTLEMREADLDWDRSDIDWRDGVLPISQVIVKPVHTITGGYFYLPGGNRFVADGAVLPALVAAAYGTDFSHVDYRLPSSSQQYRVVARVPKGHAAALLPLLQQALAATFGFDARWELRKKAVYVLSATANAAGLLHGSTASAPFHEMLRGMLKARREPVEDLATFLGYALEKPVVDETGLTGVYDWDLQYQPGQPNVLIQDVRNKLGLSLTIAERPIRILVVDP